MDDTLLRYYNDELRHLRELGGEFARAYPKVAARLGLNSIECADPYVERIIESFAFLTARIRSKLDSEFAQFTQHLLEILYPGYLSPTPSMAIVQFHPTTEEGSLGAGYVIPRNTAMRATVGPREHSPCEYRTAHDVQLWPIEVAGANYSSRVYDFLGHTYRGLPPEARAGLRIELRSTNGMMFSKMGNGAPDSVDAFPRRLPMYLASSADTAIRIYEELVGGTVALFVRPSGQPDARFRPVANGQVIARGFHAEDALLPQPARVYQGYRLLQEYFAFPERFLFIELDLDDALHGIAATGVEVLIVTRGSRARLEGAVTGEHFTLYCTPAVNLFPRESDRILLSEQDFEYQVVPDRTRPADFEVHSVKRVVGYGSRGRAIHEFHPLYAADARTRQENESGCYTTQRRPRAAQRKQRRSARSSYLGDEVFLSLVDGQGGPFRSSMRQLGVSTLCTNRDLPLHLATGHGPTDFTLQIGAPVKSIRVLAGPTVPRAALAKGSVGWRLLNHLQLNYLTLTDSERGEGAVGLRELLALYADLANPAVVRQVDGIRSVSTRGVVRPIPLPGPLTFARGSEITITCDELAFEGGSAFLLSAVLDRFLAGYCTINSYTETVLRSVQHGEVMRWPTRIGLRPSL